MNRRRFLQQSARAVPFAAIALSASARAIDGNPTVIVGAGLAGLRAADLLRKAGLPVMVLEAQGRAGGRVLTVRAPFDEGLHAEAGAIRIASAHRAVLRAVRRHRLALVPFASSDSAVTAIDKRPATTLDDQRAWTLDLKPSERGLTPSALFEHYVGQLPADLSDPAASASARSRWRAFDRVTWPEWLASRGASRDAVKLMTVGADSTQASALYVIRQYALLRTSTQRYKIAGGMDRLPTAMAASLGDIVRYNAPVVRVERRSSGFRVDYREGPAVRSTIAARIVFAVPVGTMRQIEVRLGLSAQKQRAFDRLSYYPAVRFMLQTKRRFWQTAGLSGSARTDRATETWDATFDLPASRGILGATTGGELERHLQGMTRGGEPGVRRRSRRRRISGHSIGVRERRGLSLEHRSLGTGRICVVSAGTDDRVAATAHGVRRRHALRGGAHVAVDRVDGRRTRVGRAGRARNSGGRASGVARSR